MPDAARRGLPELGAHLPADDVEAGLDRDLRDPRAHRPEADDSDPLHRHGGGIYPADGSASGGCA